MVAVEGIGSHLNVTQLRFLVDLFVYSVGSYGNNNFIFINRAVCPSVNQSYMSIKLSLVTCSVFTPAFSKVTQHYCRTVAILIQDSRLPILLTVRLLLFNDAAISSICIALNCRTFTILDIIHRTVLYLKTRLFGNWILSPSSGGSYSVVPNPQSQSRLRIDGLWIALNWVGTTWRRRQNHFPNRRVFK
jgi:hypothetical protein